MEKTNANNGNNEKGVDNKSNGSNGSNASSANNGNGATDAASANNEMTDTEIRELLKEYDYSNKDMDRFIKKLKNRNFEDIIQLIERKKAAQDSSDEIEPEDNTEAIEEVKKQHEMRMKEAEDARIYKQKLLDKIEANRQDLIRKSKASENTRGDSVEKTVEVLGDIKVRVIYGNNEESVIGFSKADTLETLFKKVRELVNTQDIKITKVGAEELIMCTDDPISKVCQWNSFTIEVRFK